MLPKEFKDLYDLNTWLTQQLNYDPEKGFSFLNISTGVNLENIIAVLGNATEFDLDNNQQQTLQYNILIDHPVEGKRDHHQLSILFWAFEDRKLEVIRLHFDYYKTGKDTLAFKEATNKLFDAVIQKLGEPEKKTTRRELKEISYKKGKYTLLLWLNTEGVRMQIK
jgi:hypothetical protein